MRAKRALMAALILGPMLGCGDDPDPEREPWTPGGDGGLVQQEASVAPTSDAATPQPDTGAPRTDAGGNPTPSMDSGAGGGTMGGTQDTGVQPTPDAGGGTRDATLNTPEAGTSEGGSTPVATCPATSSLKPGNSSASLMVGSVKRDYLLHVPSSYTGKSAVPLLLDFHPLLSSASSHRGSSGYDGVADKEGFIVAYPDGVNPAWNVGPCCTKERNVDDLGFAKALVAKLKGEACIDAKRVYAAGYSNGGGMSHHLACNAADVFAAVAPAAFDLLVENEQPCHPTRPISVLSFRSTNDNIVPYAGGASTPPTALLGYSLNTIHFLGAQGTFMRWAELNMCTGTPSESGGCKTHKQCAAGVEVSLCTSASGHTTGPAEQGWAFLKRFSMP